MSGEMETFVTDDGTMVVLLNDSDDEDWYDEGGFDDPWFDSQEEKDLYNKVKKCSDRGTSMQTLATIYSADASWATGNPLAGNIYKVFAFGAMSGVSSGRRGKKKSPEESCKKSFLNPINYLVIFLIQLFGPAAILYYYLNSASPAYNCGQGFFTHNKWFEGYTVANAPIRLLGAGFMLALSLWAVKTVDTEKDAATTSMDLFATFFKDKEGVHGWALLVGAFVNCWTIIATVWITFVLLGTSACPGDVIFNSLAVTFIMKLDDVDSDLGVIDDGCWNGAQLQWIYEAAKDGEEEPILIEDSTISGGLYSLVHGLLMLNAVVSPIVFAGMPWHLVQGCAAA